MELRADYAELQDLYAAKNEQAVIRQQQPQPLFDTPKLVERLTNEGRFHD